MKHLTVIFTAILLLALTSLTANAEVYNVPGDYHLIQEAIDAAEDQDTVLVEPGYYLENLVIVEKAITVASLFLTTGDLDYVESTIIDGNAKSSVVCLHNIEAEGAVFTGFTVENGEAYNGGGVFCLNASPTISYCHVRYSNGISGGGLLVAEGSPTISYCTVYDNSANYGGGMLFINSVSTVMNCTIFGNLAMEDGGGIFMFDSELTVENCILWNNSPEQLAMASTGDPSILSVGNSDVEGGEDGIVTNDNGDLEYGDDNIDEDPLFNDPKNGDFTLGEGSPCAGLDMGSYIEDDVEEEPELTAGEMIEALIEDVNGLVEDRQLNENQASFIRSRLERALYYYNRDRVLWTVWFMVDFDVRVAALMFWGILSREQGRTLIEASNEVLRQLGDENAGVGEAIQLCRNDLLPNDCYLTQNYPNPFNSTTKISYGLPEASSVKITVYDMTGRQVAQLVDGIQEAGVHELTWNAQSNPAGVYLVRMQTSSFTTTRQMMLTK